MNFCICVLFENLLGKTHIQYNLTSVTSSSHGDLITFTVINRSIVLRMRNASHKFVDKITTRVSCAKTFFSPKIVPLSGSVEKYGTTGQATDDNMIPRM